MSSVNWCWTLVDFERLQVELEVSDDHRSTFSKIAIVAPRSAAVSQIASNWILNCLDTGFISIVISLLRNTKKKRVRKCSFFRVSEMKLRVIGGSLMVNSSKASHWMMKSSCATGLVRISFWTAQCLGSWSNRFCGWSWLNHTEAMLKLRRRSRKRLVSRIRQSAVISSRSVKRFRMIFDSLEASSISEYYRLEQTGISSASFIESTELRR